MKNLARRIRLVTQDGRLFGRKGVFIAALEWLNGTPQEIAKAIYQRAREYAEQELGDDATVLVIRISDTGEAQDQCAAG